ncbi:MAG TPA: glycosyltransferase [Steroidobacteraceae bacterium]|nr:glycosyltransferase [Steroidobacteraceae bacterium]
MSSHSGSHNYDREGRKTDLSQVKSLLVLAGSLPYPPTNGYRIRVWHLLQTLKAMGCELHLLAFAEAAELATHEEALLSVCKTVEAVPGGVRSLSASLDHLRRLTNLASLVPYGVARFRSSFMAERACARLQDGNVDAVLCEEPFLTINLPASLPVSLIMDSHNVEHVLIARYAALESNIAKKVYASLEARKLRRFETLCWKRSDLILACSDYDSRTIASLSPRSKVRVVPNVVDVSSYPLLPDGNELKLIYTGGMDWYPNRDAVAFFATTILPRLRGMVPGVKLVVAGREPSADFRRRFADTPDIEFVGNVPDIRSEISRASVCIVPLRIGSGTRLKILEAAAMAKPMVSTSIGAEGLEFVPGQEIILADDPEEFAISVASLLKDSTLRHSMGQAARLRVAERYSIPTLRNSIYSALNMPITAHEGTAMQGKDPVRECL